jgi:glycyl-tRNA synthetase beta chain
MHNRATRGDNGNDMSARLPLLIELGCEELPVKALPGLARAFCDGIVIALEKRGIEFDGGGVGCLYTPRRLAVTIGSVATHQPEQSSEVLGPYLNIALDASGAPTKALEGFAQKAGVDWMTLERTTDNKGERFVYRSVKPGAKTAELLPAIVDEAIKSLPIPKPMHWGDHDYAFARPVHWLVLLFGDDVVDCELLGVRSGRETRGHRFHHPQPISLPSPAAYESTLFDAKVIVDPDARRERIRHAVQMAAKNAGGIARIDDGILEEVNGLTEWPVPVACSFERDFLRVPQEALILTMETNQKFFPVLDAHGKLTEHFIGIANIESSDPAEIRKGYERVIRPRFADARFFYDEDLKQGLAAMNAGLANVTYQARLGTVADKVARVGALAETIAPQVGIDAALARRAAELSKADLQSRMVNEFPELQGIAGRYYAQHDTALADLSAEDRNALATTLDEVYMPRNAGDSVAPSKLGQVLAIAERLDTLAGGFATGLKPTGNKDPFALRRNALGLARTLIESNIELNLPNLLLEASKSGGWALLYSAAQQQSVAANTAKKQGVSVSPVQSASMWMPNEFGISSDLFDFIVERLRGYYEQRGDYDAAIFDAVAEVRPPSLVDFDQRLRDLREFAASDDGKALAAANKRCGNLLRKARESGENIPDTIDADVFEFEAERELAGALASAETDTAPLFAQRRYVEALGRLAKLRTAVDAFFDNVMVMADDPHVRGNRLALLQRLQNQFLRIADIGRLATG